MIHKLKSLLLLDAHDPERAVPARARVVNTILLLLLAGLVVQFTFSRLSYYNWNWPGVWGYRAKFVHGWLLTVGISAAALVASMAIGMLAALGQRSRVLLVRFFCKAYVEVVRGSPLLVQILILYYGVFEVFGLRNALVGGVLILSLFSGAYISEMIRAGLDNVSRSQLEAARAVGFTTAQTYRYVIFPQAIRQVLPPLAGQMASLIKDSSLLSIIAISEFTLNAREVNANTYSAFESYLPLAAGYLVLTLPISWWAQRLEEKFRYET